MGRRHPLFTEEHDMLRHSLRSFIEKEIAPHADAWENQGWFPHREVFKRFAGIECHLRGGALWERGYFVMSSGTGTTDEMIRQYIKEQRRHSDANDPASEARH